MPKTLLHLETEFHVAGRTRSRVAVATLGAEARHGPDHVVEAPMTRTAPMRGIDQQIGGDLVINAPKCSSACRTSFPEKARKSPWTAGLSLKETSRGQDLQADRLVGIPQTPHAG